MSLNFKCGSCRNTFRFKGKKSQISRGKSMACPRCHETVSVVKKRNGKVAVAIKQAHGK